MKYLKNLFLSLFFIISFTNNLLALESQGIYNLHIQDSSYLGGEDSKPNLKLALLLSKISNFTYQNKLNDIDKIFLQDNGFSLSNIKKFDIPNSFNTTTGLILTKKIKLNGSYKKLIIIAFRGTTKNWKDAYADASAMPVEFFDNNNIKVHSGFHNYFLAFRKKDSTLIDLPNNKDAIFIVTGHSLGGAIAKLYAASLVERGIKDNYILTYTFGAPPVSRYGDGFKEMYNSDSGNKPLKIFEYANNLDPVFAIAYKKIPNYGFLERTGLTVPFSKNGEEINHYSGCNMTTLTTLGSTILGGIIGFKKGDVISSAIYAGLGGIGGSLSQKYDGKLPKCAFYAHKLNLYTYNIYKNLDMPSIIENNILDTNPPKNLDINFTDYQLSKIDILLKEYPFNKGVIGKKFDSSKLTNTEKKELLNRLKKLGVFINYSKFGDLGKNFQLLVKDIVDSKKTVLEIAKNKIDSSQSLDLEDYGELAWGTFINTASSVADIYSYGSKTLTKLADKLPLIGTKLKKLVEVSNKLSQKPSHIKRIIEITKTPEFQIIKALIDSNFIINDNVKKVINNNEAGVGLVKVSLGLSGELIKAKFDENKKYKAYSFILGKLVDIGVNIISGTNEVLFTDKELKKAFFELGDSLIELIPWAGPFYSEYKLAQKVSNDIDKKPEVIEAWSNYFTITQEIQKEIDILGEATFVKRLDILLSKTLKDIKQNYVELEEKENIKEENKPRLDFILPDGANINRYKIEAKKGEKVLFSPYITAKNFIECVNRPYSDHIPQGLIDNTMLKMSPENTLYKLWYYDETQTNPKKLSLNLTYDKENNTFSFEMPSDKIQIVDFTLTHKDNNKFSYSCSLPENLKEIVSSANTNTNPTDPEEKDEYEKCIANGGTEIGCRIGMHTIKNITTGTDFEIIGDYLYVHDPYTGSSYQSDIKVYDIKDINNIKFIKSYRTSSIYNFFKFKNKLYITNYDKHYTIKEVDVSDPINLIFNKSYELNTTIRQKITIDDNHIYFSDGHIEKNDNTSIYLYDITDFTNIKRIEIDIPISSKKNNMRVRSSYLYNNYLFITADTDNKETYMMIYNVNDNFTVSLIDKIKVDYGTSINKISNNIIYTYDYVYNIKLFKFEDNKILEYSDFILSHYYYGYGNIELYNNYLFYNQDNEVVLNDISLLKNKALVDKYYVPEQAIYKVAIYNDYQYFNIEREKNATLYIRKISSNDYKKIFISNEKIKLIRIANNKLYIAIQKKLYQYNLSKPLEPKLENIYNLDLTNNKYTFIDNNIYYLDKENVLHKYNLNNFTDTIYSQYKFKNDTILASNTNNIYLVEYGTLYKLKLQDMSIVKKSISRYVSKKIYINKKYLLITSYYTRSVSIYDNKTLKEISGISDASYNFILGKYLFATSSYTNYETYVYDIENNFKRIYFSFYYYQVTENDKYILFNNSYSIYEFNKNKLLNQIEQMFSHYHPITNIHLVSENYPDYSVAIDSFTKTWTFDKDISSFDIDMVSNSYYSLSLSDFIKNGNKLTVTLNPNENKTINKLVIKFTNKGNTVKVNGSDTFWAITRTNHPPRLADGQLTQLVSNLNKPASIEIKTYDGDGDNVTLTIEDNAGGDVKLEGNKLTASFSDGKTSHIIKIGLNDGKEKIIKEFYVLQFDKNSIENLYSDVSKDGDYIYDGIAFGTLKGVIWGQTDPNNPNKRIFRPKDKATLAEALKMIIEAEKKAGLIDLKTSNYYQEVYPSWAMPYYTFAIENFAIDNNSLNIGTIYPTREEIAKIIVKTLNLDNKVFYINNNISFSDEDKFSDASMLYYAKIAKAFGLFMTKDVANPKDIISRADLAMVIEKIFMIPTATISTSPQSIEYGDKLNIILSNINAEAIDSSDFTLYNNSSKLKITYIADAKILSNPINTNQISIDTKTVYAILDNNGVKNIITAPINIKYTDRDGDFVQDKYDVWKDDVRYAFDDNNNGIPDILDKIYNLTNKTVNDIVIIDGKKIAIVDLIKNGGIVKTSSYKDTDNDGIPDNIEISLGLNPNKADTDGDGISDSQELGSDYNHPIDTDGDGTIDALDKDSDNDGISDKNEVKYGLNPTDPSDANQDADGDGVSNIDEINAGTNPTVNNNLKTWQEASKICQEKGKRLPTIEELRYDLQYKIPRKYVLNSSINDGYWSNTPSDKNHNAVYIVYGNSYYEWASVGINDKYKFYCVENNYKDIIEQIDSDGDGIVDKFDNVAEPNKIATEYNNSKSFLAEVEDDKKIILGDFAKELGEQKISIEPDKLPQDKRLKIKEVFDFKVEGVDVSNSTLIVLPLRDEIPNNAIYVKFNTNSKTWREFVIDSKNKIYSAKSNIAGECPIVGSDEYKEGLIKGNNCIELLIQDGGANDQDDIANGVIVDPSGIAQKVEDNNSSNTDDSNSSNSSSTSSFSKSSSGGGAMGYLLPLILALFALRRKEN